MSLADAGGLLGVLLILAAYAAAAMGRLDPKRAFSLGINFIGAVLILLSLAKSFNLSAAAMEGSWALVSLIGLARIGWRFLSPAKREGEDRGEGGAEPRTGTNGSSESP